MRELGQRDHKSAFKRLETDDEFRQRLLAAGVERWIVSGETGAKLDDLGWAHKKMQRRIIDDYA